MALSSMSSLTLVPDWLADRSLFLDLLDFLFGSDDLLGSDNWHESELCIWFILTKTRFTIDFSHL
jgi:hypothetical protein